MDRASLHANARLLMVDGQVRPNRVYDPRVLDAMRRLPRERFLPPTQVARAYADEDVPLGGGRYLTEPLVVARMAQLAEIRQGDAVLVVAAGAGYLAAVASACGGHVVALEEDEGLRESAREVLAEWAPDVVVVAGPLSAGWAKGAPYDAILVDGGVEAVPDALAAQLRPADLSGGGRLVTVRRRGSVGQIVVGEAVGGALRLTETFDANTPVLPAFRSAPGFVF